MNTEADRVTRSLREASAQAAKIRTTLGPLVAAHGHEVHFRPASTGVAMVGLLHTAAQRGKSKLGKLDTFLPQFPQLFDKHCRAVKEYRPTPEKQLQSALIRDAYGHDRHLTTLELATAKTNDPVELLFVADELALYDDAGKVVCDLLALRVDGGRSTPVLIELKNIRAMERLTVQVDRYSRVMEHHREPFAAFYSAVLGREVKLDEHPVERWFVWPLAGSENDPQEQALAKKKIRVVGYRQAGEQYTFRAGDGVA